MAINSLFNLKQLFSCTLTFIVAVCIYTPYMNGFTIRNFPESDFVVVDQTTHFYIPAPLNPNGLIGYKFDTASYNSSGKFVYQLVDSVLNMKCAIWNTNRINFTKSWMLTMKIFIGNGIDGIGGQNQNMPTGDPERDIGDGICFIAVSGRNINNLYSLISQQTNDSIGYGGITNSLAVEYDTEVNIGSQNYPDIPNTGAHVAILQNGSMVALEGTYNSIRDNWQGVAFDDWLCTSILCVVDNNNGNTSYELLVYISEVPGGPLRLRSSKRFYSLEDLLPGASVDSNGNAWEYWGVSAFSCPASNRYMVEFLELTNGDSVITPSYIVTIGFMEPLHPPDTFYVGGIANTDCGKISRFGTDYINPKDTIKYDRVICHNRLKDILISVPVGMDTSAYWEYKKGSSWDSVGSGATFPIKDIIDSIPNNTDSLLIRLVSGTDTIYFNIKYPKEKTALKDYFRDSVFKNTGYTDYPMISDTLSIKLPTLDSGCSYFFFKDKKDLSLKKK